MSDEQNPHRLPPLAHPERYDLVLAPDLATSSFSGSVAIDLVVDIATDHLVCNAADLDVDAAWITLDGDRVDGSVTLDQELEQARVGFPVTLAPGAITLHLTFRGVLNDKLRGFYRSTFTNDAGETSSVAVTQFEATDARRAFPCWDEPAYKAVFGVTLEVAPDLLAVSNGPELARETVDDHLVRIRFADTMPMSTYLVAFVVGPLEATAPVDVDGIPLRIIHRPGQAALAEFAQEVGAFALRFFADYYGIAYPGDKMDMVAVPDFAFGAMENLGCVIYRETLLLVDPETATQSELLQVVDVIAHELAHMWFGDLVTMSWWNGIWLNEAFATFMEMKCSDAFRPQWDRWMQFGRERSGAFDVDALRATRPIEYPVHSPADAEGMFDVLTYQKGSAVVRMLEQYLGPEAFRDGIRRYLQTHQFGNTETGDLWDALEAETGEPVRTMMDSWIFQGGFPLVGATTSGSRLTLTQQPFQYLPTGEHDREWKIPVVVRDAHTTQRLLLDGATASVDAVTPPVVVNAGGHAFYRVDYDAGLRGALVEDLGGLTSLERYAVLDDMVALSLRGDLRAAEVTTVIARLAAANEQDLSIWQLAGSAIDTFHRSVHAHHRHNFSRWVQTTLEPVVVGLGFDADVDDDDRRRAVRGLLFGLVATHGEPTVLARAVEVFDAALRNPSSVDAELAAGSLKAVATHASPAQYAAILDRFRTGETPQEQLRYLYAAAAVRDRALFAEYLQLLDTDQVRSQNLAFAYRAALRNVEHGDTAWEAVRDRWERIRERLPFNAVHRLIEGITSISDAALANEIAGFVLAQDLPEAAQLVAQHVERMEVQVEVHRREADRLIDELT